MSYFVLWQNFVQVNTKLGEEIVEYTKFANKSFDLLEKYFN